MRPVGMKDAYDVAAELGVWQGISNIGFVVGELLDKRDGLAVLAGDYEATTVIAWLEKPLIFARQWELPTSPELIESQIAEIRKYGKVTRHRFGAMVMETNRRVADELGKVDCFRFTSDEAAVNGRPIGVPASLGGDAAGDGREAVRCYAAGCYTAAGFHAVRIAERIARSLIPKAGLRTRKFYPSIDSIVSAVEKKLKKEDDRRRKKPKGRRGMSIAKVKWLSEVVATFRSVTNAWRNPIGHYKMCDDVEALELIHVARALVRKYGVDS
jgi:hypothetical protein